MQLQLHSCLATHYMDGVRACAVVLCTGHACAHLGTCGRLWSPGRFNSCSMSGGGRRKPFPPSHEGNIGISGTANFRGGEMERKEKRCQLLRSRQAPGTRAGEENYEGMHSDEVCLSLSLPFSFFLSPPTKDPINGGDSFLRDAFDKASDRCQGFDPSPCLERQRC